MGTEEKKKYGNGFNGNGFNCGVKTVIRCSNCGKELIGWVGVMRLDFPYEISDTTEKLFFHPIAITCPDCSGKTQFDLPQEIVEVKQEGG